MRPVRVVMQAFGPFARMQVVDFRELGESRFFLIHGPTGSGKTTVLDAMCYALYGVTTGAERTAEEMRSQFAPDSLATEVVFDFAIGDECYRVRRQPAQERAKARSDGTTTVAAAATLWRRGTGLDDTDDGTPLATKNREVDAEVRRLIGFDAVQFRQVVMLPQGRFRELLSADSKTREDILQALFATKRFGDIEFALKRRKSEIEVGIEKTRTQRDEALRSVGVTSDEQLAEVAACDLGLMDAANESRSAAQEAARAAGDAAESGRVAAGKLAALAVAEASLAQADAAVGAAEAARAMAVEALTLEKAREPERVAAAEGARWLSEVESAVGALEVARGAELNAHRQRDGAVGRCDGVASQLREAAASAAATNDSARQSASAQADAGAATATHDAAVSAVATAERLRTLDGLLSQATLARDAAIADRADAASRAGVAAASSDEITLRWRDGRAATLAAALELGAPCPVCGSLEHPAPAHSDVAPPSDGEVVAAEDAARAAATEAADASAHAADAERGLAVLVAERAAVAVPGVSADVEAAHQALETARVARDAAQARAAAAASAEARALELDQQVTLLRASLEDAQAALADAEKDLATVAAHLEQAEKAVPEDLRAPGSASAALEVARDAKARLDTELEQARILVEAAALGLAEAQATQRERAATIGAARREADGVTPPDLDALQAAAAEAAAARDRAVAEAARIAETCAAHEAARARIAQLDANSGELLQRFTTVAAIADAASGANPRRLSFQRYVLGVFLTEVLQSATRRLEVMTRGRYRLHLAAGPRDRRSASGLDLEVFDEYTGDDRPVGTLSGGEGFLASLALALGLAEVVESLAGGVHLDTVFVDEGFGTLDEEALETAIDALMELQGAGRLVGIISHVTELQAVVPARLEISSGPTGSTARFIVP
jgi:exonuclease SbcC